MILSCFHGIYILLGMNFYQVHYNIHQSNILMIIPQFTALMHFMIIVTIIGLILFFVYFINNGIKLTNNISNDDNHRIFGNILPEVFNYIISMDGILCRHRINDLALINVHLYFYTYKNETQIVDHANHDLSVNVYRLCIDNYNITNVDWIIICKVLDSYIIFYVNYDQLNGIIIMTIILQPSIYSIFVLRIIIMIIIALFGVYSSICKFKGSNIVEMYIFCNVLCKN